MMSWLEKDHFNAQPEGIVGPTSSRFPFIDSSCMGKMMSPFRFITCMRILNFDYNSSPIYSACPFIIHDCEIVNQLNQFNNTFLHIIRCTAVDKNDMQIFVAMLVTYALIDDGTHIVCWHYSDVIMSAMAYQITGVAIVCSTVFYARIKEISKIHVTGLCEGNPPMTDTGDYVYLR